jgi:hypothetical protein
LQAYEYAEKFERDRLHKEELGIAQLTMLYLNSKIDTKKTEPYKTDQFCFWLPQAKQDQSIASSACDAFFSLVKDNLMPAWVVPLVPIEQLKSNQAHAAVSRPRAWVGEGVLLLVPRIVGKVVTAEFAVIEGRPGTVQVKDVDSGKWYTIDVSDEDCCLIDAEFPLLQSKLILPNQTTSSRLS